MSADGRFMYSMRCDHPEGCSVEIESDYGGSFLYASPEEGRAVARDYDWVTDGNGKDYCWDHRANVPEYADAHPTDSGPVAFDTPLTHAESEAYWDAITDDAESTVSDHADGS